MSEGNGKKSVRATVSIPSDHYRDLEEIASEKKVSISWVVRDAIEDYLRNRWPLLQETRRDL